MPFDFEHPLLLALLPLALLPLRRHARDTLVFSSLAFLPADRAGYWLDALLRSLFVVTLATVVVGLAAPGTPSARVAHTGHGAEILILFDRSSSMDLPLVSRGVMGAGDPSHGASKNAVARRLLTRFVEQRPDDRFAFMAFGTSVMPVAPFTDHNQATLAGLAATAVGRGLPSTDMGNALEGALAEFRQRRYSGSRIILLVSDGGAKLDAATRRRIADDLSLEHVALYFVYIRNNGNSPDLETTAAAAEPTDEMALHHFFLTLATPYHLYQAEDSNAIAAALADIDRQQNLPLTVFERIQRRDFSARLFGAAALGSALLLAGGALRLRRWS